MSSHYPLAHYPRHGSVLFWVVCYPEAILVLAILAVLAGVSLLVIAAEPWL